VKVLLISTEKLPVPPVRGGAIQTYIQGVAPYLSERHDLTVLGRDDPQLPSLEQIGKIRYVRVPGGLFDIYRDHVVRFLSNETFDVIHIFNRPRLVHPVRNAQPGARIILSMHNDMFFSDKITPPEAETAIAETDRIITISNYIGQTISQLYPQAAPKLRTIYSGVDLNRFVPWYSEQARPIRDSLRAQYHLQGKKVILFAGRLSPKKGADVLLRAMPELARQYNAIALVLIGGKWYSDNKISDYVAYLRSLAARSPVPVITTGYIPQQEIHKWFTAGDIFVCPSQWQEPLARVHYEAMASGLPIITTARGGNPEVIIPGVNGLVVQQPENPMAFVEALMTLLSDETLCRRMGEAGRKLAQERYTWERVANEIIDVWETIPIAVSQQEENASQPIEESMHMVPNPDSDRTTQSVPASEFPLEAPFSDRLKAQTKTGREEKTVLPKPLAPLQPTANLPANVILFPRLASPVGKRAKKAIVQKRHTSTTHSGKLLKAKGVKQTDNRLLKISRKRKARRLKARIMTMKSRVKKTKRLVNKRIYVMGKRGLLKRKKRTGSI